MYSLLDYGKMLSDPVRTSAYAESLRRVVRPGSVVVDIGTGSGIFALLACRCGARRVYAIEREDIIQVAREIAAANHCSDRIEFIQDLSTRVTLPEQADVVVSDLRGILPWFDRHIAAIADARRRFLRPGGTVVPQRDTLWAALVEAPEVYADLVRPWSENQYGFDLRPVRPLGLSNWYKAGIKAEQFLSPAECWATLDYTAVEDVNVCREATWTAVRGGACHGFAVWFDTVLVDGVGFSNSPAGPQAIYGTVFFPWLEAVTINPGDKVSLRIEARIVAEDYVWTWDTCVFDGGATRSVKASFKQSTFYAEPLSPKRLQSRAADCTPALDEEGRIDQFILGLMDGQHSLGDIARRVAVCFPRQFDKWESALARVGELSEKYTR